jgi:hypothetical protein
MEGTRLKLGPGHGLWKQIATGSGPAVRRDAAAAEKAAAAAAAEKILRRPQKSNRNRELPTLCQVALSTGMESEGDRDARERMVRLKGTESHLRRCRLPVSGRFEDFK